SAFSSSQKLFLRGVENGEGEAERPGRPPIEKGRVAVYVDLLQSGRMRHRRDERGIHLVNPQPLCHGYVSSAVECDRAIPNAAWAATATHQTLCRAGVAPDQRSGLQLRTSAPAPNSRRHLEPAAR